MTAGKPFVFRFEDVEVREREFTLTKAGEVLPVEPKAFRVLLFLLHNPQTLITKEELLDAVWADAAVTESSLTRSIAKLRRVLGDDFQEPRYIATVATVGYRFVCKVEVAEEANENLGGIGEVPANGQAADANLPAHNDISSGITGQTISSDTQKTQSASEITKEVRPAARRLRWIPWGVAAALLPLLAWLGFARWMKPPSPQRQSFRLSIQPPPATSFVPYSLAVSPDGRRVAFVAAGLDGATALWVRSLVGGSYQQLSGTENALYPFWSADSREIGFSSGAKLKRADPNTGAVQVIGNVGSPFGDTWNDHGTILFAWTGGLYKVDASGGAPQQVTRARGNEAHRWPSFLPDQDHFLYFVDNQEHPGGSAAVRGIYVGSLTSMENKKISSEIIYAVQFASGRLFFVRDRSLMAQPFDLQRLELTGKAEVIAPEEIEQDPALANTGFSVSSNGVVVFQSAADNFSRLSWFDRQGKDLESVSSRGYRDPSLSGDGSLLAITADEQRNGRHSIRIYDFARSTSTLVSDGGTDEFPALSRDGKTVAYGNSEANTISTLATDNSGQPQTLVNGHRPIPNDWSRDGRYLVYMDFPPTGAVNLAVYDLQKHSSTTYGPGSEAQFSPDGKWIAFTELDAGRGVENYQDTEIFVAGFPNPGAHIQISNHGGAQARWRADGKELYFIGWDKKLMAVAIDTSHGKVEAGVPHALFQTRIIAPRIVLFQYAVSPDGKRFLINSLPPVGAAPITVLIN
jgi:DNA-binding winged helix-turn-helix (wHTH) protein/Tol biopolymer transport system component